MTVEHAMTKKFLEDAFAGESMAHMRYLIFAEKAEKEGNKGISNLFKAISYAEFVHARNHYRALGNIKSTTLNLGVAIEGEHYENTEMYPVFNQTAKLQEEKGAELSTRYALEAEKIHEKMYRNAKSISEKGRDIEAKKIYICPVCGYTSEGKPPEKCPICGAKGDTFISFKD
jgi:rubrerythrin